MKISPVVSQANSIQAEGAAGDPQVSRVERVRSMRMNVNRTPGTAPVPPPAAPAPEEKLTIQDPNDAATGAVEATEPLSPQLAALAKQRRALQAKERELAEREKALAEKPASAIDLARLKSEPLSVLLEAGVTYDQLTEAILADQAGNGSALRALQEQIKALQTGMDEKLSERDKQAEQAVLAEMRKDAERFAKEGDQYELIRETNSVPAVMQLIERTYRESGEVLDVREAMELVETELVNEGLRLAASTKVKGKLLPEQPRPASPQQRPVTLTNRDTAQVPMGRKERALLAFHGQLNK